MMLIVPISMTLVISALQRAPHRPEEMRGLFRNGDYLSAINMILPPMMIAGSILAATLRSPYPVREYLGLARPGLRDLALAGAAAAAVFVLFWFLDSLVPHSLSEITLDGFRSAKLPLLFIFSGAVFYPVGEEMLLRGLIMPGFSRTRFGWAGGAILTAVGWGALSYHDHWLEICKGITLGLLCGWFRHRSGSVAVPIACSCLYNLAFSLLVMHRVATGAL